MSRLQIVGVWAIIVLSAIAALVTSGSATAAPEAALRVWAESGMARVARDGAPAVLTRNIELYAARGEYEPFQVVVRATRQDLTINGLKVSPLVGPEGYVISRENITRYREHYVRVRESSPDWGGSNRPQDLGWYADALIPFIDPHTGETPNGGKFHALPFVLRAGSNQPFWVDIYVPRDAPGGDYAGTFTVTTDHGTVTGSITLHVWDFELPLAPTLLSTFLVWKDANQTREVYEELLRHKVMPERVGRNDERALIDAFGLRAAGLGFWGGPYYGHCEMEPAPTVDAIRAAVAEHQSDLLLYNISADEIDGCPEIFPTVIEWAKNLHAAGVKQFIAMTPNPALYDDGTGSGQSAVDIWVVLPEMYDSAPDRVAHVMEKGDQVWSYNALVQDAYSPKWQIDFSSFDFRLMPGFINASLGLTGIQYWRVDLWTGRPWRNIQTFDLGGQTYPGDGMLVYPARQVGMQGVVPSMRLKWIREGIEDYEYVALLKSRGQSEFALNVARSVGADWTNWTRNDASLQNARKQLGDALSER